MELLGVRRKGRPAVVFLPGAGEIGRDYWNVHRRAAELSMSVTYDRAGTGGGTPAELPRTSTQATDELRGLLRHAGIAGPCLLVGHSLGGLYARQYAIRFPDEVVAALLLLDPAHEDLPGLNASGAAPAIGIVQRCRDCGVIRARAGIHRSALSRTICRRATQLATRGPRTPDRVPRQRARPQGRPAGSEQSGSAPR
ncbi:MAG: alpha/beta fold hydrolase [Candidatus Dormibacteraceae bacterium]